MSPLCRISIKRAQYLLQCSPATAHKYINIARAAFGKQPHQLLSEKEFCKYYDIK